jgi:hypothetical protein
MLSDFNIWRFSVSDEQRRETGKMPRSVCQRGAANREIKINVQETARYQAWFEVGEKYLVYARGSEENEKLWETRCSRSKLLADASEDIKVLGKARETVKK